MRKVFLITSAVWAIFLTGCSKDNDSNNNIVGNNPPLVKKLSLLSGTDTTSTIEYSYDNLNRVSTIKNRFVESGVVTYIHDVTFHYSTSDSLPDYFVDNGEDFLTGETFTGGEYFYYDASRRMIKDSLFEVGAGSLVYEFQYFPSYIKLTTDFGFETTSYQTFSNGNIIQEKDTVTTPISSTDFNVNIQQTFDTKINPLFRTQFKKPVLYLAENYYSGADIVPPMPNNATTYNRTTSDVLGNTDITQISYNYTYNTDNTPASVIITDVSGGGTTTKVVYQYY